MASQKRPRGIWLDPYRAKIPGATEQEKVTNYFAKLDELLTKYPELAGYLVGVTPHGFSSEFTPEKWQLWRDACWRRGLACGVGFGIGTITGIAAIAARIAQVAALPGCAVVLLDCEGQAWEQDPKAAAAAAETLCTTILRAAPRVVLANQSWPVPTYHSGYPFAVFAKYCQCFAEQRYYNDWKSQYGTQRYRRCEAWFDQSWGTIEKDTLAPAGNLVRPHNPTIQGYAWDDLVMGLVTCLAKYDGVPVFVWSEWWPTDSFWLGARCVAELHVRGYGGESAVWDFQTENPPLTIDGLCGPATREALGVAA